MRKLFYVLAAVSVLCVSNAVSYQYGKLKWYKEWSQTYDDAGRMSDLIRCYSDHLHQDSLIEDYGCFDELKEVFLFDDGIGEVVNLSHYCYGY